MRDGTQCRCFNLTSMRLPLLITTILTFVALRTGAGQASGDEPGQRVIENFEGYDAGDIPYEWMFLRNRRIIPLLPEHFNENEEFYIVEEGGRKFVRVYTKGEAQHIILVANDGEGGGFGWNVNDHPRLSWEWRAHHLPEGAREDRVNDTGAAVYVTFGSDWLGRPRSIKYTYSSGLPVGTVVRFGALRVLVVDTALEGIGSWRTVDRDVVADYRQIFGGDPPDEPVSITLWSDSDNTNSRAEADFDNIRLLPQR